MRTLLKPLPVAKTSKLLQAARDYPCAHCHKQGYTVAAHCNELALGRGFSHKTPDFMVAYLCGDPGGCHDAVDGRAHGLPLAEKRAMWNRAYAVTVSWWFRDGLVVIS